jgi:hypothetical protein
MTIDRANKIALEAHAAAATAPELVSELVRVHKEHFRVLAQASL